VAYAQIIDPEIFEPMTAPGVRANAAPRSDRTSLVAVAPQPQAAVADARVIVGHASYGPGTERCQEARTVRRWPSPGTAPSARMASAALAPWPIALIRLWRCGPQRQ
jgi:hypothetical protein